MAEFSLYVMTEGGVDLMAQLETSSASLQITKIGIGDGSYEAGERIAPRTALKQEKHQYNPSAVEMNNGVVKISCLLNNSSFTSGMYITEVGLYAADPDGGSDILLALGVIYNQSEADFLPRYGSMAVTINLAMYMTVSTDVSVTLVAETGYATSEDLQTVSGTVASNSAAIQSIQTSLGAAAGKDVANNLTTASGGSHVLDAYQGKALKDLFDSIVQGAGTVQYIYNGATFITSSKKDIAITIPTNRVIPSARTIASVHLNSLSLRQDGNYLYNKGTGENFSDMEVTVTKRTTGIHLNFAYKPNGAIEKQEYPNATNNAAVGVYVDISITWV